MLMCVDMSMETENVHAYLSSYKTFYRLTGKEIRA